MGQSPFNDPPARRAYLLTKAIVFAVAALATWPLARAIGPKAWIGLAVFGVLLAAMTVLVPGAGAARRAPDSDEDGGEDSDANPEQTVELPVEDSLDLHSFIPRDIPEVVTEYLAAAHERGLHEVRLIHGRGVGVQRDSSLFNS